ncbi:MAG: hypothetical protein GX933_08940 [Chloroflexi bacterium]|nr:hypothetical protein [Chloroflexota bacterium]
MPESIYYVFGHFNQPTEEKFKGIRNQFSGNVVPLFPHITLGGYAQLPLNTLINWVHTFANAQAPLKINFNHIGWVSGGFWFIAPRVSMNLLVFHRAFHANYDSCLRTTGYNFTLCSENWVPHVSVFSPEENATQNDIDILLKTFRPFSGEMTALSIYEEQSNQPLARFELNNLAEERERGKN